MKNLIKINSKNWQKIGRTGTNSFSSPIFHSLTFHLTYFSSRPVTFSVVLVQASLSLALGGVLPVDLTADEIEEERGYLGARWLVQPSFQQQHGKSRLLRQSGRDGRTGATASDHYEIVPEEEGEATSRQCRILNIEFTRIRKWLQKRQTSRTILHRTRISRGIIDLMTDEERLKSVQRIFPHPRNFDLPPQTGGRRFESKNIVLARKIARFPTIYDVRSFTKGTLISGAGLLSDLLTVYELETGLGGQRGEITTGEEK